MISGQFASLAGGTIFSARAAKIMHIGTHGQKDANFPIKIAGIDATTPYDIGANMS